MAYKVIILYRLYMPFYFLGTFTEYPSIKKAREIRFKPASRAFYVITLIIFCEIMLLAFWL